MDHPFVFATGIECSAPIVAGGVRHDQLLSTGHWTRYEEDARLIRTLGIPFVRYGIPFHVVARDPGRFDWEWTDRALETLRDEGIAPIVDLLHFAVPDDLWGVGDPRLVGRHAAFVEAFVTRYPWIRWFTPVNEPYITALFSGRRGYWNERGTDDASFVRALDTVLECAVRGAALVRGTHADAVIVQSDACDGYTAATPDADAVGQAVALQEQVYLGFDLTLGRAPSDRTLSWLAANGMDERRVGWFLDRAVETPFIVGLDYYDGNERLVDAAGVVSTDPAPGGFASMARRWLDRYGLPVMLAETNMRADRAVSWLDACWDDAMALRAEGRDLVGFCWYSLTDQVDWDIALREFRGNVNSLGLVDLSRRFRPVASRYAELARLATSGELPGIGDGAASQVA
ncbi:MAG TPA: family 1 glycosylhydrolase [Candidatus Limnocylindrales bacterium]|nr:family 1 glycosylhydrolase [Candidatus Limnocylindrales bacterium]